ncbi:phosphate-selective porin O and P [Bacteroides pyogenes F0041]|uniref:Phosphate-selective porin O and P n=1 Tax=Bacteroides pyogenes F0041 TaxID=1321819 RepID=U2C7Z2_9BACE|nr:porin [Bacteroides pyogenes]ERI86614.1 phosphate-selective porin O and P [Bacteroides pyogenes F0041]
MKKIIVWGIAALWTIQASAQEGVQRNFSMKPGAGKETSTGVVESMQDKFSVKLTGRALFDAATYAQNNASEQQIGKMNEGVCVRDMRIGFKASYGKWSMRGDVSLSNNAVSLKDTYLQYSFEKNNFVRAGHYTVPFGLSSAYSSAKKEYMDEPEANIYQPGRRIGVMHTIYNNPLWFQYGLFADNSALSKSTDKSGPQGYTAAGRFVWRPVMKERYGLHVGFSAIHVKAESNNGEHARVLYGKGFLTSVDKRKAVEIDVTDARWENKFTVELQAIYHNFQLSSQYYWSHISRDEGKEYNTGGFYVSARGIVVNPADYKYNYAGSGVDNPDRKNLELALGYGYLDLRDNDALAGSYIDGFEKAGKMQDITVGLSLFWNKNVTFRAGYHHITVNRYQKEKQKVDVFQCRVQYLF